MLSQVFAALYIHHGVALTPCPVAQNLHFDVCSKLVTVRYTYMHFYYLAYSTVYHYYGHICNLVHYMYIFSTVYIPRICTLFRPTIFGALEVKIIVWARVSIVTRKHKVPPNWWNEKRHTSS